MPETITIEKQACTERRVLITASDLPISCPPRDTVVWNAHPRVYLALTESGQVLCPYCGTTYVYSE